MPTGNARARRPKAEHGPGLPPPGVTNGAAGAPQGPRSGRSARPAACAGGGPSERAWHVRKSAGDYRARGAPKPPPLGRACGRCRGGPSETHAA